MALAGLLLVVIVSITGGFVLDAGPLHLSVRNWLRPLTLAVLAAGALAARGGLATLRELGGRTWPFLERHATVVAVVAAVAAGAGGIAWNTYAASGSDAAGYVSEAGLLAAGRLSIDVPLSLEVDWPEAAEAFSPLGYRPGPVPGQAVPTYPPGLPLAMVPAHLVGPYGPYLLAPLLGAAAVFAVFLLGRRLHSPLAGVVAAVLFATSPILLFQITQPMSDVPAAAWWALALMLAARGGRGDGALGTAALAGAAAGMGFLTRPVLLPMLMPTCLALFLGGARWRSLAAMAATFAPFAAGLAVMQYTLYGSPLASGHGSIDYLFQIENVPENLWRYGARLARGEAAALILIALAVLVVVARRRTLPQGPLARPEGPPAPPLRPAALLAAASLAAVLLCYLPYGVFNEWSYLRFLLPAFPALFVYAGALVAAAFARLPDAATAGAARGALLLLTLAAAGAFNINEARRQEAFLVRRSEARYQIAGRYLSGMLPGNAVVIAGQQSASAHYYAQHPVVRWDLLRVGLDKAVADLNALGRHPVLVLEEWEERDIRARFPDSPLAHLDWRPVADIGDHVRVRVYDPAHRGRQVPDPDPRVDRVHAR